MSEKSIAILTIKSADRMTPEGREKIADWLHHCAESLVEQGSDYSPTFRARYKEVTDG